MANQRFGAGWAATEGFEHVCRGATPAEAEHGVEDWPHDDEPHGLEDLGALLDNRYEAADAFAPGEDEDALFAEALVEGAQLCGLDELYQFSHVRCGCECAKCMRTCNEGARFPVSTLKKILFI